ncbi:heme exporter protein CcmD [Paracoccus sp. IB05]|uniref:heme exporter protein CcmD n=1 Tax=Paracoccus sp. IB05 TaxID=2779367 RepID=UPI0018E83D71|nr:heme exporter protein CcmD [Paracoccus sp. IB05]MBJ2150861.1 heme exporter protein CcmD [Paracoccus sp. IB05]
MMPDLGDYAATVLGAWGATLLALAGLLALTLVQSRRVARALTEAEARVAQAKAAGAKA